MPFYEVYLRKEKTYWWDEDDCGNAMFAAKNDEEARKFVATILQRINRKYWRIGEQRNVSCRNLFRLERDVFSVKRVRVSLWNCMSPAKGFRKIRKIIDAFYPKQNGKRSFSIMTRLFTGWKPIPFDK